MSWNCLWNGGAILGEGVLWDARDGCLWWVDIRKPMVHWMPLDGGAAESWAPPEKIGSLAPRATGGFVAGTRAGFAFVDPRAGRFEPIANPEPDRPGNRFNDGATDAHGRFWAGTMDGREQKQSGALYRLDADRSWRRFDDDYGVTNGPAFSPDGRTMYHNDSARQVTYAFDLAGDGTPSNRRVFIEHDDGYPDGMACDADGFLWIAMWDGWSVRRFAPDGVQVEARGLPVARPTRPVFGGANLDRLFVISASVGVDTAGQPLAGGLFEIAGPGALGQRVVAFAG